MSKSLNEAAVFATDLVEEHVVDGKLNFPETTFADLVLLWSSGVKLKDMRQPYWNGASHYYEVSSGMAFCLAKLASSELHFYQACARICAANVFAGVPIPQGLEAHAAGILDGRICAPKPMGPPRQRNFLEKQFLLRTIELTAERFDIDQTQDDGSERGESSCDIVAKALTVCGRKTRYTELKNLATHPNHKRLRKEIKASFQILERAKSSHTPPAKIGLLASFEPGIFEKRRKLDDAEMQDILSTFQD